MKKKTGRVINATLGNDALAGIVADSVPYAYALFDEGDRLVLFNDAYRRQAVMADKFLSGHPTFEDILRNAVSLGRVESAREHPEDWIKWRLRHRRDPKSPIEVINNDGRILRVIEQLHENGYTSVRYEDISELRSQQRMSRESKARLLQREEHFRGIMETVLDAIITTYEDGVIDTFNPAAERIFDYRADNIIGENIENLIPPSDRRDSGDFLLKHLEAHEPKIIGAGREMIGLRKDGSTFSMELKVSEGDYVGRKMFICVVRDITERKAAEKALRLSEERFAMAMKASSEGIWDWDIEAKTVHVSQRILRSLGIKGKSRIAEKQAYKAMFSEDRKAYFEAMKDYLRGKTVVFESEFRHLDKSGKTYWMHSRALALRRPNGRAYRIIGSISDITARKQNEESLRTALEQAEIANRSKTDFLANVSHELRTPLNAIIGFSDLITSEIFGPIGNEKYLDYTKTISESGLHLLDIINDILDVARVEVGKLAFRPETIELEPVFESCLRLIRERSRKAGLSLRRNIQGNLPHIKADPRRLKQIMLNLLSNAVKFTPPGGTVMLKVRITKIGTLVVLVKDTGIGMKASDIPRVMNPFVQVDSKLSRSYDGIGLGLPLTKTFIEMHGGKIKIKSALGKGTSVTIYFPTEARIS